MPLSISNELIAIGANRHVDSADWDQTNEILAFGGGHLINLWRPLTPSNVYLSLKGHTAEVTCVKFVENGALIISASADGQVNVWSRDSDSLSYSLLQEFGDHHQQSVTTLSATKGALSSVIVSGSSDGHLAFWVVDLSIPDSPVSLISNLNLGVSTLPLASAIAFLPNNNPSPNDPPQPDQFAVAVGNTSKYTYIYVGGPDQPFSEAAKLEGQSDWVRALAFSNIQPNGSIYLASGCQDRYIRIWNLFQGSYDPLASAEQNIHDYEDEQTRQLSNKVYPLNTSSSSHSQYSMKFDALIIGHDDWIYSLQWHPSKLQLMSSSADSSIMIWSPDQLSGVWLSKTQLGDISIKGASTATGAYGGMWFSSWIGSDYRFIISLSNTGAWKCWSQVDENSHIWKPERGISGHFKSVTDVSWSTDGRYLLSTGLDKTTRLFAPWLKSSTTPPGTKHKWYEMARPQIHGYDMIAIESLSPSVFVSAGDEKVLRAFTITKSLATLLNNTIGLTIDTEALSSGAATVPALGLSNKAGSGDADLVDEVAEEDKEMGTEATEDIGIDEHAPPLEDQLQRLTLWPEIEKIYGHGYEVTTLAISHDRSLVVSSCKANSKDHAVIRITDTQTWQKEFKPLSFHTLTPTSLKFSPDDKYLLSVSRDRTWALWQRNNTSIQETGNSIFDLLETSKLHTRIVWDCCWAHIPGNKAYYFFTASRDKTVKVWTQASPSDDSAADKKKWENVLGIQFKESVTAIDIKYMPEIGKHVLAAGLDDGAVSLIELDLENAAADHKIDAALAVKVDSTITPSGRITKLAWNPHPENLAGLDGDKSPSNLLAIASEDRSVRILKVSV